MSWEVVTLEDNLWSKARKPRSEAGKLGLANSVGTSLSPVATGTFLRNRTWQRFKQEENFNVTNPKSPLGEKQRPIQDGLKLRDKIFQAQRKQLCVVSTSQSDSHGLESGLSHELCNLGKVTLPFLSLSFFPPQRNGRPCGIVTSIK